jgi:hypothetical protein
MSFSIPVKIRFLYTVESIVQYNTIALSADAKTREHGVGLVVVRIFDQKPRTFKAVRDNNKYGCLGFLDRGPF